MSKDGKAWFKCRGVRSDVLDSDKNSLGHICMLDVENATFKQVKELCNNMFDVAFVFQSSYRSHTSHDPTGDAPRWNWHIYNPVIRGFEDTKDLMSSIALEDDNHVEIGYERGDWVLRISDKPDDSKKVPEYAYSVVNPSKRKTLSEPHLRFLEGYFEVAPASKLADKMPTAGKTLEAVEYWTYK